MLIPNCMNGQTAHPVRWPIRVCLGNTLHGRFGPNLMMQPKIPTIWTDMVLANNDDHRWELFYQDWLNSVGNNIPNQASTLTKGYDLPNLEVAALGYDATLLGIAAESAAEIGVSQELWTRILSDPTTGDDRTGPGYRFLGEDITLDSVRYYNNQIRQWKMMLAENELEKINARTKLFEDIEQFADVDNLSDWATNLEGTAEAYNSFSIDDFGEAANNEGQPLDSSLVADASLWNDAHFQPFFITFSGGGAEFTQTITRTNIEEYTKTRELTGTWNDALSAGLKVNGAGFVTDSQDLNTITETRANSETSESSLSYSYTLSDDDEQDFYLVAVIPGRGMNGPIFLNLGSAASCPFVHEEPSSYPRVVCRSSFRRITNKYTVAAGSASSCSVRMQDYSAGARSVDPADFDIESEKSSQAWPILDPLAATVRRWGQFALETSLKAPQRLAGM